MPPMKTKSVELNEFESEMIFQFVRQHKDTPVTPSLCRAVYRCLEEKPTFARTAVTPSCPEPSGPVTANKE